MNYSEEMKLEVFHRIVRAIPARRKVGYLLANDPSNVPRLTRDLLILNLNMFLPDAALH